MDFRDLKKSCPHNSFPTPCIDHIFTKCKWHRNFTHSIPHVCFISSMHSGFLHFPSSSPLLSCDAFHMDPSSTSYIGYVNGASCYSRNLALAAWAIFTPIYSLILSNGICIGSATNNQAEYDAVIGFLVDALDHRILHIHVRLDSLLLVMQLKGIYHVNNHVLFNIYLQVKFLAR